jgi:carbamoyltransferase
MLVLGISGGLDPVYENREFLFPTHTCHDSAAVLVDDGKVVAAIEEERLNRIKHTSKGAVGAIRLCLNSCGLRLKDIDRLAIYGDEKHLSPQVKMAHYRRLEEGAVKDVRDLIHEMLITQLDGDIKDDKLYFVPHHMAHAMSAFAQSGFEKSLVLTIDGIGDTASGLVLAAQDDSLQLIHTLSIQKSLGLFYLDVIRFLGYDQFEEYKVMGLAPYGDPSKYRPLFRKLYKLLPDGDYTLNPDLPLILCKIGQPRRRGAPFTQAYKDIAAALQEALEEIAFHILRHYQKKTGQTRLCLAGGVAHNCTLNGRILYSGLFEEVFVQPASHDAGCALGAALYACREEPASSDSKVVSAPVEHVYWGTDIGSTEYIYRELEAWGDFIESEFCDRITMRAAELLAQGAVIGWVQGRSEFGPRALGNRSILADPRPAENKDMINKMVKKREAYRPFAPAVLEEYVDEFFDLPRQGMRSPFMTFVVKVREDKRGLLRATTHVDGTARIQTVSRETNQIFWELIDEFRKQTNVPILLNTSFNNNAEPIVDSTTDAVVCFLTTGLNYLVVGNYLVRKKAAGKSQYLHLVPSLAQYARLTQTRRFVSRHEMGALFEIKNSYHTKYDAAITPDVFAVLQLADGRTPLGNLIKRTGEYTRDKEEAIVDGLLELWSRRLIVMSAQKDS